MIPTPERVRDLFLAAVRRPVAQWDGYLTEACAGDDDLRRAARELLDAHVAAGSFLESPAPDPDATRGLPQVAECPGTAVGPYKLLEQIGEGGFGVVFLAEQAEPVRRRVALKVLKPGMDTRQVVARFEAERQALALMDHPNIAKVLDAGATPSGRPYVVMELVKGVPITDFCDHNHLTPRQRLELFVQVCGAIQHAHQKGIIHRDLKPSNVLVSRHDTVPVVKVIDFGVAKALGQELTDKTLFTGVAQMVGTPLYMSPEQAGMSDLDVDTRSDIYSLGVLLYELLTGTTPFAAERFRTIGYDEIRRIIREEEPPKPSTRLSGSKGLLPSISARRRTEPGRLTRLVRGELDWIVMKALEKNRNRRYDTATGFAADVQRYLADDPVLACPPSVRYRASKYLRRNRAPVIVGGIISLALFGALLGAAYGSIESAKKREVAGLYEEAVRARDGEARAKRAAEDARERLAVEEDGRTLQVSYQECRENNVPAVLALLARTRSEFRGWEWWYVHRLCRSATLTIEPVAPDGTHGTVFSTAFGPDGTRVLVGFVEYAAVMDAHTGARLLFLKGHTAGVSSARFNKDGTRIATGSFDGTARVWDAETGAELRTFKWRVGAVLSVSFSPGGEHLLTAGDDNCARVWDIKTGKELVTCSGHTAPVKSAAFNHDGTRIVTAGPDNTAIIWDAKTGTPQLTLEGHTGLVSSASFSPTGEYVVSASYDRTARVWDATSGKELLTLQGHTDHVHTAAFSPGGSRIVTGSWDRKVRVWDAKSGAELFTLNGHTDGVTSASFSPDGTRLLTGCHGLEAMVWNVGRAGGGLTFDGHTHGVSTAAISPDGLRVVSLGLDKPARPGAAAPETMLVWDARTGDVRTTYKGTGTGFQAAAFSPDGVHVVTGCRDGTARVWDSRSGEDVRVLRGHTQLVLGAAFNWDGTRIATCGFDQTVRLWDANTGAELLVIRGLTGGVVSVAFSPDRTRLVTAEGSTARLWDANSGTELATIKTPLGVQSAAFSPDGTRVVTAGTDETARVWDARTRAELLVLNGHTNRLTSTSFSPDGSRILTASHDRTVRLWDAKTGVEVLALKGHTDRVAWAAFSPDGMRIVSVSWSEVRVWDLLPPAPGGSTN